MNGVDPHSAPSPDPLNLDRVNPDLTGPGRGHDVLVDSRRRRAVPPPQQAAAEAWNHGLSVGEIADLLEICK
jgi:hypothetical protein